jgi:hypothetical protein
MKGLRFVVATISLVVLGVVGCKNNVAPPTITFGDTPAAVVNAGASKEVAISVKAPGKLKKISFFCKNANGEEELFAPPVMKFPLKDKYESVVTIQDINACIVFIVEAIDSKNQISRGEYVITISDSTAMSSAEPATATAETTTAPVSGDGIEIGLNKNTTIGSSFRVKKNKTADLYWAMQYSNSVDFMFFFGKNNGVSIVAPADELAESVFNNEGCGVALWETRNVTVLVKSSIAYDAATLAEVETEVNTAQTTSVTQLKAGDVVSFKTASGQIGVVRLAYVGDSNASTLNINVKVLN